MIPDVFSVYAYSKQLSSYLAGGIFQKLKLVHPEIYRMKIYVPGKGNLQVYFDITGKLYVGKALGEQYSASTKFTQIVNKYLKNQRLVSINLVNFDRILEFKFSNGNKLIFEWMSRGNLILVDQNNIILAAAKEAKLRDREILPGKPYVAPPKPVEIPKKYLRLGLQKQVLMDLVNPEACFVYRSQDGRILDVLPFKIEDLHPGAYIEELRTSLFDFLNELYMEEIYQKISTYQRSLQNKDLLKKAKTIQHIRSNLQNLQSKLEQVQKIIEFLESNYDSLEELRSLVEKKVEEEGEEKANEFLEKISKGKARLVREKENLYIEINKQL